MYQTRTTRRQRLINRQARHDLLRLIVHYVGSAAILIVIALFFNFVIINWLSGCGERFPTADGGYIQGECIYPSDLFRDTPRPMENQ